MGQFKRTKRNHRNILNEIDVVQSWPDREPDVLLTKAVEFCYFAS